MKEAALAASLLVLVLVLGATGAHAADTMHTHLNWTQGSFELGLQGAGKALFPEGIQAPDHERIPFTVNPCHRQLSLGLAYEPRNASARLEQDGNAAEIVLPYRFRATLIAPDGSELWHRIVEEPDKSLPFGEAPEPGAYELELELLEGAMVDWQVRMRGFDLNDEPTCDLWLNEVELNPAKRDAGEEWVEIYNEGSTSVDLSDWWLRAVHGDRTTTIPVPDGLHAGAGDWVVVDWDAEEPIPDQNASLELVAPVGGELDASPRLEDTQDDGGTHQRSPDGTSSWVFAEGTPGEKNVAG